MVMIPNVCTYHQNICTLIYGNTSTYGVLKYTKVYKWTAGIWNDGVITCKRKRDKKIIILKFLKIEIIQKINIKMQCIEMKDTQKIVD